LKDKVSELTVRYTENPPFFLTILDSSGQLSVAPLRSWEDDGLQSSGKTVFFTFVDPSPMPSNPGWPLRNLLVLLSRRWALSSVSVLCLRDLAESAQEMTSSVLDLEIPCGAGEGDSLTVVGWEANARGKPGARSVDLSPFMDPSRRAGESADLNLKLMRWRFLPDLEPERLAEMPVLLLGSGTLGCNVARSLTS